MWASQCMCESFSGVFSSSCIFSHRFLPYAIPRVGESGRAHSCAGVPPCAVLRIGGTLYVQTAQLVVLDHSVFHALAMRVQVPPARAIRLEFANVAQYLFLQNLTFPAMRLRAAWGVLWKESRPRCSPSILWLHRECLTASEDPSSRMPTTLL